MMSDVPFGVFLSGGVDSSANVALMSEQMSRPVETFTVGFSDHEYLNELESARRIARDFGTNHHEVIIAEDEMHDFLPQLVFHQDEPIADPVCVPLYYVSKLARDNGTSWSRSARARTRFSVAMTTTSGIFASTKTSGTCRTRARRHALRGDRHCASGARSNGPQACGHRVDPAARSERAVVLGRCRGL